MTERDQIAKKRKIKIPRNFGSERERKNEKKSSEILLMLERNAAIYSEDYWYVNDVIYDSLFGLWFHEIKKVRIFRSMKYSRSGKDDAHMCAQKKKS